MTSHHSAFETLSESELGEYRSRGILLRHKKTGCEVYRLVSEDEENVFAFMFRTGPRNSTGVAHIVEHSVLCGSERFPVKDSFLVMARRSLATFMNAFTYPDKTVYPAASAVEADYFNLLDVYGDAVFHPLLTEETFLQEAHHLELSDGGELEIKGVVYNEMRGDYSSSESLAATASYTSLFSPGHPYSFDSGGDPEAIPSLSYADFKAFWTDHYHPSNCRIFLYGDIDTARQLDFLDRNFLSQFEARKVDSEIPLQSPLSGPPRRIEVPYPIAEGADSATSIVVNWLTVPVTDGVEALALELLSEILLGNDGAPLAKALRDSELGEDLSPQCGLDTSFRQILFSAGLRGTKRGDEAKVEELILDAVGGLVRDGIRKESLEAALHSVAFANREIRRGSGAYGLRLFNRAARGWLHGAGPEATLSFESAMQGFMARLATEPRYLEELAERYIVGNRHRSTVTVYPDPGLLEKNKAHRSAALAAQASSLDGAQRLALRERASELAAAQGRPDSAEAIAKLPRLALADIPRIVEKIPRVTARIAGRPASLHPLFTNGIVYLELAFPLDGLPRGLYPWLPLLTRFVTGAGIPGTPYDEMAELLARKAGGFGAMLNSGTPMQGGGAPLSFAVFRLKALAEKFPEALELALGLLGRAHYGDLERVADLYAELRNDVTAAIVPSGHAFAQARAQASFSEALAAEELWRGPSQLEFLMSRKTEPKEALAATLAALGAGLFTRQGLRLGLTGEQAHLDSAIAALEKALPESLREAPAAGYEAVPNPPSPILNEAFSVSAQVGFSAGACKGSLLGSAEYAHETILAHLLTTGPLWEEIRVKRGAYGAFASADGMEGVFTFSSYRDPRPVDSLSFFAEALGGIAGGARSGEVEEAAIGSVGRDLRPMLPEEKGLADFKRELYGISDELRQTKRDALLAVRPADLAKAAARLAEAYGKGSAVLISHASDVQLLRRAREGTRVTELPL